MVVFQEAAWSLVSAPQQEIQKLEEGRAMSERIAEWLATPEGTVAHNPSWGNNLRYFKHDPMSPGSNLEVLIELALTRKLPLDIEDLILLGVKVEALEIDACKITIVHQYGVVEETLDL